MNETKKSFYIGSLLICLFIAIFAYAIPAEGKMGFYITRAVLTLIIAWLLYALTKGFFKKDKVPDYINDILGKRYTTGEVILKFDIVDEDDKLYVIVYYQNQFNATAVLDIWLRQDTGFFNRKAKIKPIEVKFNIDPADFGEIKIPLEVTTVFMFSKFKLFLNADSRVYGAMKDSMVRFKQGKRVYPPSKRSSSAVAIVMGVSGMISEASKIRRLTGRLKYLQGLTSYTEKELQITQKSIE